MRRQSRGGGGGGGGGVAGGAAEVGGVVGALKLVLNGTWEGGVEGGSFWF